MNKTYSNVITNEIRSLWQLNRTLNANIPYSSLGCTHTRTHTHRHTHTHTHTHIPTSYIKTILGNQGHAAARQCASDFKIDSRIDFILHLRLKFEIHWFPEIIIIFYLFLGQIAIIQGHSEWSGWSGFSQNNISRNSILA